MSNRRGARVCRIGQESARTRQFVQPSQENIRRVRDEVLLFPCPTIDYAKELEQTLLKMMQPNLNQRYGCYPAYTIDLEEKRRIIDSLRRDIDSIEVKPKS